MVTANVVQDQLRNVQVAFPLPFAFDLGGISASGGHSTSNPRSAHECSRVDPLHFAVDLGGHFSFWW